METVSEIIYAAIEDESHYYQSTFYEALSEYHDQILSTQWQSDASFNPRYEYILSAIEVSPHQSKRDYCEYLDCELSLYSPAIKTDDFFQYLERRSVSTVNEIVRARCCHIIWLYNRRNDSYPTTAIASYMLFAEKKEVCDLNRIVYLGNAFMIAVNIKNDTTLIKEAFIATILSSTNLKAIGLGLDLILAHQKVFKSDLDECFISHIYNIIVKQSDSEWNYFSIYAIERVINLNESLKVCNQNIWYELLGDGYIKLALTQESLFKLEYYTSAAWCYKKAKNDEKANRCSLEHRQIWERHREDYLPLRPIERPILDLLTEAMQVNVLHIEEILSCLKELPLVATVITIVFLSRKIIPDVLTIKEFKTDEEPFYMYLARLSFFDAAGNSPVKINNEQQENQFLFRQAYGAKIVSSRKLLSILIPSLVAEGVLESDELMQLLEQLSILRELRQDSDVTWVDAVKPALNYYLNGVQVKGVDESTQVDFSLSIDSLILKLEGILRGVFELRGISAKKVGERKSEEVDLNRLLIHPSITTLYDENHLAFLRYVLVDQFGFNFRNVVAHSLLMDDTIYNESNMHLVFVCFLIIVFAVKPLM